MNIEIGMYLGGIDVFLNVTQKLKEGKYLGYLGIFVRSKCDERLYENTTKCICKWKISRVPRNVRIEFCTKCKFAIWKISR